MKRINITALCGCILLSLSLVSCKEWVSFNLGHSPEIETASELAVTCEKLNWENKPISSQSVTWSSLMWYGDNYFKTDKFELEFHRPYKIENDNNLDSYLDSSSIILHIYVNLDTELELNRKYYFRSRVGDEEYYITAYLEYKQTRAKQPHGILQKTTDGRYTYKFVAVDGYFKITDITSDGDGHGRRVSGEFVITGDNITGEETSVVADESSSYVEWEEVVCPELTKGKMTVVGSFEQHPLTLIKD